MAEEFSRKNEEDNEYKEKVVQINRVTKVVKGGKKMGFRAVVIVGDGISKVGLGIGKANEVASAIRKAVEDGKKAIINVPLVGGTIPHDTTGKFSSTFTHIKAAPPGKGVIAGGAVRSVLELVGIKNVVAKSIGSSNPINVVRATLAALANLKDIEKEKEYRGVDIKVKFLGEKA